MGFIMKKIATALLLLALIQVPALCDDMSERLNIYYNNGVTNFKDKKYSSAILEFKKVLRNRPYDKTVQNALAMSYLARANYYTNTEKSYKKGIVDLRSTITYLELWNGEIDPSKQSAALNAKNSLKSLTSKYAPLNSADAIITEAKAMRSQGELAASIYLFSTLYNNNKYQKTAYETSSDIYKSLNNQKMALETIRQAISTKRDDGMLHFKYALILDDVGNEDAAMDEYSKALEYSNNNKELLTQLQNLWMARSTQNPKDSQALINLGAILQKQNQFELAKAQYLKARQINPNDPVILINLASVFTQMKDYDNAIKIYDEILAKNKGDLSARLYKGKLYEQKGDIASAMTQYKEILALKKDDITAQNALNSLLSNLSGAQLAGYLKEEADKNPTSYDAQFKYAFEMHKNKGYLAAVEYYKKAVNINPKNPEPFINMAQIFILQNDYEKAKNVVAHGLSNLPDNKDLKELQDTIQKKNANDTYAKASELYNSGKFEEALNSYLQIKYQTPEINSMIANCYYQINQSEKALEYYNKVIAQDNKNENALLMIANIFATQNKTNEAKAYLNKILSINPNNIDAKNTLAALNEGEEGKLLDSAIAMYENKKYNDSMKILNKIVFANPKNTYAHYYKGLIFEEQKDFDSALAEYKKTVFCDPDFSIGYYMIALTLDNKENYKEAVSYYDKFIQHKAKEGVEDEYSTFAKSRTKELKDFLNKK